VVAAQVLGSALRLSATAGEDPRQVGFVNEDVGVFGETNQVVAWCGVAGDDDRLSATIEAVTEGGDYGAMVHVEGCDLQTVAIIDSSLLDDMGVDGSSGGRLVLGKVAADMNVGGEELDHAVGEFARALGTVQLKGHGATFKQPTGVEEVGES